MYADIAHDFGACPGPIWRSVGHCRYLGGKDAFESSQLPMSPPHNRVK
jgi:hypothetical protein